MELIEVINRLESNGIQVLVTMLNGSFNQINCCDNPRIGFSTWFEVNEDETVDVDEDFSEYYPN